MPRLCCFLLVATATPALAGVDSPTNPSFNAATFVANGGRDYAIDTSPDTTIEVWIRPPHSYDTLELAKMGEFQEPAQTGCRRYRLRIGDLPLLARQPDVRFSYVSRLLADRSPQTAGDDQYGAVRLQLDLPFTIASCPCVVDLYYESGIHGSLDTTDPAYHCLSSSENLSNGVVLDSLLPGYYDCRLTGSSVRADSALGSNMRTTATSFCPVVYVGGIVVIRGFETPVVFSSVPGMPRSTAPGESESKLTKLLEKYPMLDQYVIRETDSGLYADIIFELVDGDTHQVDSAGVVYSVWGQGLYSATVPLTQTYELRKLCSVYRVNLSPKMRIPEQRLLDKAEAHRKECVIGWNEETMGDLMPKR